MEIGVLDASVATTKDVVFAAAAADKQLAEHVAPAYDVEPWPVVCYKSARELPPELVYLLVIVDDVPEGELGDHDALKTARVLYKNNPDWVQTLSHEVPEMFLNINVNLWLPHPARPGFMLAREVCDPCQAGKYPIDVTMLGETRTQMVSDFVLPSYWVPGAPGPYSYMDAIDKPGGIAPGGYQIVRRPDGGVDELWAGQRGVIGARAIDVMASGMLS